MTVQLDLGEITVDVVFKDIKNIHLSVYPPSGRVHISAPERINLDKIRVYTISKLDWIKKQQKKLREQERETPREYLDRESHHIWGKRYLLKVKEEHGAPLIKLKHNQMILRVRPGTTIEKKKDLIAHWYRDQIKKAAWPLIAKWEPVMGVKVNHCFVQRMKTKWGSCNPGRCNIRFNTELAKKPLEFLEYIVVHEMIHLLVPCHDDRFVSLMDKYLPNWKLLRQLLNATPLGNIN